MLHFEHTRFAQPHLHNKTFHEMNEDVLVELTLSSAVVVNKHNIM